VPEIERIDIGTRISRATAFRDLVFLAGQASPEPAGDPMAQTTVILGKIDALLARARTSKEHILFAQIHLADIAHFDAMNEAWVAWLPPGAPPARTVVEARLPRREFLVEITVVAVRPETAG
jgi:enamine deaminase RidA (YjgF/YER057c/UK114 family)